MIDFNTEIKHIGFEDIAMGVNYRDLGLLQNHLMHEVKRMGVDAFVSKYTKEIISLSQTDYEYNLCVAILNEISGGSCGLKPRPVEKWLIDPRIAGDYVELNGDISEEDKAEILKDMNDSISDYIPEFKSCGILFISFDEVM